MRKIVPVVLIVIVGCAVLLWYRARVGDGIWSHSVPNRAIRAAVANVRPDQVAAIRLDILPDMLIVTSGGKVPKGLSLQPGFRYITRENPKAIALLLEGLQKAASPAKYHMGRMCSVQIILKNGTTIGPFMFGNHRFADCFSPEFISGLKLAGVRSLPHR